jgi:hypothetical protein
VTAEVLFHNQIKKIKRRVAIQAIHRILLNAALIFLAINTMFQILTKTGIADYQIKEISFFIPIGVALSAALFIGLVTKRKFLNVLIEIDQRLRLQDRLSTAYEYLTFKKKTKITDLLMTDAATKLNQIDTKRLVPTRFSILHLLAIILLILNVLLHSGVFWTTGLKSPRKELQAIEAAGNLLKNYTINRIENNPVQKTRTQSVHTKKLEQLSHTLNDNSESFDKRFAALDSYLNEVRGEQTRLATELGAKLDSAGIKDIPIQRMSDPSNLSSRQLEKLKKLLNRMLNNQIPASIHQDIESLQELDRLEKLLFRIIDEVKDGKLVADDSTETVGGKKRILQATETAKYLPDDPNRPKPGGQFSDHSQNAVEPTDQTDSGNSQRNGDDLQNEMDRSEGYSDSAGRAESNDEKKPNDDLEKTKGSALQDKMTSSRTKSYLIHIRALTDIGEARFNEEEVIQSYRKEIESILKKEDIPNNYREYIKNYFISIGLNTEENAHEFK